MHFLNILVAAVAAGSAVAAPAESGSKQKRKSKFMWTGVNQSGGEFGQTTIPGTLGKQYTWPVTSSIDTLMGKGFNTFRIPFLMERAVPSKMTGSINATYFQGLEDTVKYITSKGAYAVVDPHNFGRYYGNVITSTSDFAAFWKTIAARFAQNSKVIFDTNNEYNTEEASLVAQLNQAAINAIRSAGATSQYIFVEGTSWSGAHSWSSSGNAAVMGNLTDPQNKIVYELHQYLDSDSSGTSPNCVSASIGVDRIKGATDWLKANNKKAILGETAGGANSQCISAMTNMLTYMETNSDVWQGWLWWGGGPWWADYMYSIEPPSGAAYTGFLPSITKFI